MVENKSKNLKYYYKRVSYLKSLLGGKCVNCGVDNNLEFDHIEPSKKSFNISLKNSYKLSFLLKEIEKCQLLCTKCHKEKHMGKHGTISRYRHQHCRCQQCKDVWNKKCKEWKNKRKNSGVV